MVVPEGAHNIAMTWACLVSGWLFPLSAMDVDTVARNDRITLRGAALRVAASFRLLCFGLGRACFDVSGFLDLELVMGSSGVSGAIRRTGHSPAQAAQPAGQTPGRPAHVRYSNAPIRQTCQLFL